MATDDDDDDDDDDGDDDDDDDDDDIITMLTASFQARLGTRSMHPQPNKASRCRSRCLSHQSMAQCSMQISVLTQQVLAALRGGPVKNGQSLQAD